MVLGKKRHEEYITKQPTNWKKAPLIRQHFQQQPRKRQSIRTCAAIVIPSHLRKDSMHPESESIVAQFYYIKWKKKNVKHLIKCVRRDLYFLDRFPHVAFIKVFACTSAVVSWNSPKSKLFTSDSPPRLSSWPGYGAPVIGFISSSLFAAPPPEIKLVRFARKSSSKWLPITDKINNSWLIDVANWFIGYSKIYYLKIPFRNSGLCDRFVSSENLILEIQKVIRDTLDFIGGYLRYLFETIFTKTTNWSQMGMLDTQLILEYQTGIPNTI